MPRHPAAAFSFAFAAPVTASAAAPTHHRSRRLPPYLSHPLRLALRRRVAPHPSTLHGSPPPPNPPTGGGGGNPGDPSDDDDPPPTSFSRYLALLARYPLPIKSATSALLTLLSDLIAQLIDLQAAAATALNPRRLLALFLVGGLLTAPLFHYLYNILEAVIPASATPLNLILQLSIDQLLAAPLWLVSFFALVALLEGRLHIPTLTRQLNRDFIPALKLTWTVFPPVQLASFAFLTPSLRLLALNLVDIAFTTVLSYLKHRPLPAASSA